MIYFRRSTSILTLLCAGAVLAADKKFPAVDAPMPLTAQDRVQIESIRQRSTPPVTVPDLIGLTTFGSSTPSSSSGPDTIVVSPDRAHVAVLVQRGDLAHNTREFALLVFQTADLLTHPSPDTVAQFASTSNRPAISRVTWLPDNTTLAFLGERPGGGRQVYTFSLRTKKLTQRTHAATVIRDYAMTDAGDVIIYVAEAPPPDPARYAAMRAHGFVVSPEVPVDHIVAGHWLKRFFDNTGAVHVLRADGETVVPLPDSPTLSYVFESTTSDLVSPQLSLAPAGDRALVRCLTRTPSADAANDKVNGSARSFGGVAYLYRWIVLDLRTGHARPLINSSFASLPPVWTPDGRAVRLMDEGDVPVAASHATPTSDAETDVRIGALQVLPRDDSRVAAASGPPPVQVEQGANTPWRLVTVHPRTHAKHIVYDPNPTLMTTRRFAHVTVLRWSAASGEELEGTLYWPTEYVPGTRYPLVIQTHGMDSTQFQPEGVSTTGFAAQPLAGRGIMVLQMGRCVRQCDSAWSTYLMRFQASVEGVIDHLDRLGLIERAKIGLQSWSISGMQSLYVLTHSRYPFAAATATDCWICSYSQFFTAVPLYEGNLQWVRELLGELPVGATLETWTERLPGFKLDQITAPLQLGSTGEPAWRNVLSEWEIYAGLLLQGKPVELVYLPDARHNIVKPWERITSQQGAVDWYRFWLQGYERMEPITEVQETANDLADQYARWRKLRDLRDANAAKRRPPLSSKIDPQLSQ